MNNTFNFRRFLNYFCYDITNAKNNTGLSIVINGAMPVFTFAIYEIFSLLFTGHVTMLPGPAKMFAFIIAVLIITLYFPTKQYGSLTDKKSGSAWLMIPASGVEKWLSMLLVTCLALPAFVAAELFITDGLLSLLFTSSYGPTTIGAISELVTNISNEINLEENFRFAISTPYALYLNFCENVLFFTLGAVYFKKSKIGKTFLSLFCLVMVLFIIMVAIFSGVGDLNDYFDSLDLSPESIMRTINIVCYSIYVVVFGALDLLLYLRIKALKH